MHILRALFGVARPPSDTSMRERLDRVDHRKLRGCFSKALARPQREKVLEHSAAFDGRVPQSLDGTQYFPRIRSAAPPAAESGIETARRATATGCSPEPWCIRTTGLFFPSCRR